MKFNIRIPIVFFVLLSLMMSCQSKPKDLNMLIIAHRGASGYLPEHTLPAKALAYGMHPDFLEQDVVLTKDDVPIVIHDIHLETTTNVSEVFPNRNREDEKFYVIDFTWEELQLLNVTERFDDKTKQTVYPNRFPANKSIFKLHTLAQEIEMIQGLNISMKQNMGIYVEIKEPQFHRNHGKDISKIVLKVLSDYGYKTLEDNCILQCFDAVELKKIRQEYHSKLFLVQLLEIGYADEVFKEMTVAQIVDEIALYANGIGPWYKQIIAGNEHVKGFENLVSLAHQKDLKVHAFTYRADDLGDFKTFKELLLNAKTKLNFDGIFTDFPDQAVACFKQ
ncbi:glycerophosphoryl diester phosphodiesterase [Wenyingzhuangia fucanilytica]|uniref:glycerophosphodiester phosphodiesterase n=1 Tax=Wenyingzhuangia fucanilytica TaxID=1790137 RepID=A0A1B1Y208_9FLAO|nr:glycerophosphodiester phosphodiesterase [Wenyingzhuangia fucanilytica]ANW94802.1 glycerophosphoryl diester phosphodiesterase [Wenyingzhuangia fucanilytica]